MAKPDDDIIFFRNGLRQLYQNYHPDIEAIGLRIDPFTPVCSLHFKKHVKM